MIQYLRIILDPAEQKTSLGFSIEVCAECAFRDHWGPDLLQINTIQSPFNTTQS